MNFIETHLSEPKQAKPVAAVREAFDALKKDRDYTRKMVLFLGVILGIIFWVEERFGISGIVVTIGQLWVEAIFIFYWHRFFLLGEAKIDGQDYMPFLKRSLFYYLVVVLVVSFVALLLFAKSDGFSNAVIGGLAIILTLAFLIIAPRIALVFPAIAIGNPARSMADAFVLSSGNVLRLAAGYFLMLMVVLIILVPISIVVYFVDEYLPTLSTSETYMLVSNMFIGFLAALTTLLWAGMNSSFYRQLGGDIHPTTDLGADEGAQDNDGDSDGASSAGYGDKQGD